MSESAPKPEKSERKFNKIEVLEGSPPEDELDRRGEPLWVDFDFGGDLEMGVRGPGPETYIISPVSDQDLFSDKYINCTGVVGIGRDKETGKNIAFISHQDPEYFLNKSKEETENFTNDLRATLATLSTRSGEGTIEVVLFGGNVDQDDPTSKKTADYKRSIELLSKIVKDCIGQVPVVAREARHEDGAVDVLVFTQERKIFIE